MATSSTGVEDILAERRSSYDFRWATKTWTPHPCFVRGKRKDAKEIIELVLESDKVRSAIRETAARENRNEKDVEKQAKDILTEMAHDFHLYAVRWFAVVLSKISKRLYSSIQVDSSKIQQIKQALVSYPVVLLPTHRSYVDFLLVSFMFFHYNLPLPIIAAGMDFMGMVGVGEMLRKAGAFFIRRRFGGDILYWALVAEYVKKCGLHGGHPIEMFIEGTRSRSGKSISPKIGLLSAILEMVWNGDVPDILILPISMSYDRTLEERLYAHELLGQPKPKESTNGLMKALRWLSTQSYGSIYVNFGDLISVREYVDRERSAGAGAFTSGVQHIALESVLQHQKHLIVPMFPLIATIVLSKISREEDRLSVRELILHVKSLQAILGTRHNQVGFPIGNGTLEENVQHILLVHNSLCTRDSDNADIIVPVLEPVLAVQFMLFQHYSNQLLPLILPCCLVSYLLPPPANEDSSQTNYTKAQLYDDYVFLREMLREDFPYQCGTELEEITWAAAVLESLPMNTPGGVSYTRGVKEILARAVEPYLIAYWGVMRTLLDVSNNLNQDDGEGPYEMKQLGKTCQNFILHQMRTTSHLPKQYGALSLETLGNAILSTVHSVATTKVKLKEGAFGVVIRDKQRLSKIHQRLEKLLGLDGAIFNTEGRLEDSNFSSGGDHAGGIQREMDPVQLRSKL